VTTENDDGELSTLLRPASEEPAPPDARFVLTVAAGPDRARQLVVDGTSPPRMLIGHGPACHLLLTDRQVSRRHAAIELAPRGLKIIDLGSKNGTTVNGVPIGEAYLTGGEQVVLGETTLHVEHLVPASAAPLPDVLRYGRLIGASKQMRRLYPIFDQFAQSDLPVCIEGETGTGKELLAEALHEGSPRAAGPFIVFDCAAAPPTLLETMLFGHERGAFTGATSARAGVFEEAHGGTLFLDEIGELDPALQPKLLRAIDRRSVQRIGSHSWCQVDVRIIAATRRDLDREVQAGRFRDDLFFRLAVGRIELPPLRERTGDVALLARHFWRVLGGEKRPIPQGLIDRFCDYPWPGNVRELHNAVARALAVGDTAIDAGSVLARSVSPYDERLQSIPSGDLIERILDDELPLTRAREKVITEFERRYVNRVLERYNGSVARAASASGIARRYFQLLRARYAK
jgi:transcriptional regulator with GAF, ATPase, and Fis domain